MFYVFIRILRTALQLFETKSIQRSNDMKSHEDFHSLESRAKQIKIKFL